MGLNAGSALCLAINPSPFPLSLAYIPPPFPSPPLHFFPDLRRWPARLWSTMTNTEFDAAIFALAIPALGSLVIEPGVRCVITKAPPHHHHQHHHLDSLSPSLSPSLPPSENPLSIYPIYPSISSLLSFNTALHLAQPSPLMHPLRGALKTRENELQTNPSSPHTSGPRQKTQEAIMWGRLSAATSPSS
jgi:hypothetical protein